MIYLPASKGSDGSAPPGADLGDIGDGDLATIDANDISWAAPIISLEEEEEEEGLQENQEEEGAFIASRKAIDSVKLERCIQILADCWMYYAAPQYDLLEKCYLTTNVGYHDSKLKIQN
jgi:hypothetical protein